MGDVRNYEVVKIKRLGVVSLANLSAIISAMIGFLIGLIITLLSFLFPQTQTVPGFLPSLNLLFSKLAVVIYPVLLGIFGWIQGIIYAIIYNISAKITGGIELYS